MKIKKGFILHQMGDEYMAVGIGEAAKQFDGIIRLNETGAFLWKLLEDGADKKKLADELCARYEGVDFSTALNDVEEFLSLIGRVLDNGEN